MLRPNRGTIEGYFLAGKHMFWLPVSNAVLDPYSLYSSVVLDIAKTLLIKHPYL